MTAIPSGLCVLDSRCATVNSSAVIPREPATRFSRAWIALIASIFKSPEDRGDGKKFGCVKSLTLFMQIDARESPRAELERMRVRWKSLDDRVHFSWGERRGIASRCTRRPFALHNPTGVSEPRYIGLYDPWIKNNWICLVKKSVPRVSALVLNAIRIPLMKDPRRYYSPCDCTVASVLSPALWE